MTEREAFIKQILQPILDAKVLSEADGGYFYLKDARCITDQQRGNILIFADWLTDQGECLEALFYRWLASMKHLPIYWQLTAFSDYGAFEPWRIDPGCHALAWCIAWLSRHRYFRQQWPARYAHLCSWHPAHKLERLFAAWKLWQELQRLAVPEWNGKKAYLRSLTPEQLGT